MFITQYPSDQVLRCSVLGDGSFANCVTWANANGPGSSTYSARFNSLYVAEVDGNAIQRCDFFNASCIQAVSGLNNQPVRVKFYGESYALVNVYLSSGLKRCLVTPTGQLADCTDAPGSPSVNVIADFADDGTYLYFLRAAGSIYRCQINTSNATLTNCAPYFTTTISDPRGTALGANYLLISSLDGILQRCPLATGGSCTTIRTGLGKQLTLTLRGNQLYIPDFSSSTVTRCNYNDGNGTVSGCTPLTTAGFNGPTNVNFIN